MSSRIRWERRLVDVSIKQIDPQSEIHQYRIWCYDATRQRIPGFPQTVEFTPSDTVPLRQLLQMRPRGTGIYMLTIDAPTKLLSADKKELMPGAIDWSLRTLNCPARVLSSPKIRHLHLNCEHLPPAHAFKDDNGLCTLTINMTRLKYWPVQLAPSVQNLISCVCSTSSDRHLDAQYLLILHCLDQLVKCGLAAEPTSPWSVFLKKGLYDPRLLLHITAFVLPFLVQ